MIIIKNLYDCYDSPGSTCSLQFLTFENLWEKSINGDLLIGLISNCDSLGFCIKGGCVARQYDSKTSDMCSHASSSRFSSSITSNIFGEHWANFSDVTI